MITLITAYIFGTDTSNTEINSVGIDGKRPNHSPMAMVRRMNGCGLVDGQFVFAIVSTSSVLRRSIAIVLSVKMTQKH